MSEIISGKNAVLEAIKSGMTINKVMIAEHIDEHFVGAVLRLCRENHIPIRRLPRHKLNQLAGADNRGIAAEAASASYAEVDDILDAAAAKGEPPFVVLLDGIEDPHNLGAVSYTNLWLWAVLHLLSWLLQLPQLVVLRLIL